MPDQLKTAEPGQPRRRWFQFRLRTLLVGVALLAIPLGYLAHEWRIVRARNTFLDREQQVIKRYEFGVGGPFDNMRPLPSIRRMLGDEPQRWVVVVYPAEKDAARKLFPESIVLAIDPVQTKAILRRAGLWNCKEEAFWHRAERPDVPSTQN